MVTFNANREINCKQIVNKENAYGVIRAYTVSVFSFM